MMRTVTLPSKICRSQHKPDACCRRLPRCRTCGRVLAFDWHTGFCFGCEQKEKATAATEKGGAK